MKRTREVKSVSGYPGNQELTRNPGVKLSNGEKGHSVMFLRFIVSEIDEDSERELGVFHAVRKLRESGALSDHEEEHHDLIRAWFNQHLEKPTRFTTAKPPFYRKKSRAISWFKDTAHEHLVRVRQLVTILKNHEVPVQMLKTDRVGYVVYEDEYQVVAELFAGDGD